MLHDFHQHLLDFFVNLVYKGNIEAPALSSHVKNFVVVVEGTLDIVTIRTQ